MATAGIGVDIVEIDRMRRTLDRTPGFAQRVFTQEERSYCDARSNPAASYAGCFAAREAVLKALGCGFAEGVAFDDVSVTHDPHGRPQAVLRGRAAQIAHELGVVEVHLSISHTRDVAVANAVAATDQTSVRRSERVDERAELAARFKEARSLIDDLEAVEGGE